MIDDTRAPSDLDDLAAARRAVLVRKPLHWRLARSLIVSLERAWRELDAKVPPPTGGPSNTETPPTGEVTRK